MSHVRKEQPFKRWSMKRQRFEKLAGEVGGPPTSPPTVALLSGRSWRAGSYVVLPADIFSHDATAAKLCSANFSLWQPPKVLLRQLRKIQQGTPKAATAGEQETAVDIEQELRNLFEPTMPVWRRFKTNNATIEKLHEIISQTLAASFRLQTNSPG